MALKQCKECHKDVGGKVNKCPHCGTDQRSWPGQHPILTVFGVLIGFIIFMGIISPKNSGTSNPITSDPLTAAVNTVVDDDKETISKSEFDQIKNGMTYDQVVSITKCQGTLNTETGSPGSQFHTVMYSWKGHGSIGANANAMFQGGRLMSKAQIGLE